MFGLFSFPFAFVLDLFIYSFLFFDLKYSGTCTSSFTLFHARNEDLLFNFNTFFVIVVVNFPFLHVSSAAGASYE